MRNLVTPIMFGTVQVITTIVPSGDRYGEIEPDYSSLNISYHGYELELTLSTLELICRDARKLLEKTKRIK